MNRGVLVPIISMKLSRSSDIHRYFLSVEWLAAKLMLILTLDSHLLTAPVLLLLMP